jgi:DinB superfamily
MSTPADPDLAIARGLVEGALGDLLAVDDDTLEAPWTWPDHGELDRRSGFFRTMEDLDAVTAAIVSGGAARPADEAIVAPATIARWELLGLLAPLTEADLDADPGGGEWTVRQTVAHIISSQHSYGVTTAWWRDQAIGTSDDRLPFAPDGLDDPAWDEAIAANGSIDQIRSRLHLALEEAAARLSDLSNEDLALAARWSGLPVTIAIRQGRWASHITEHTVQVDKTLVWLGRQPSEVERLVRLVAAAWGRLEANVWPRSADAEAIGVVLDAARGAAATAASIRAAGPA